MHTALLSIFPTGENFHCGLTLTRTKISLPFTYNYTYLVIRRVFPRLASGSCFKPCFSHTTHILKVPAICSYRMITSSSAPP